tara:strand:+ start:313 stop:537 length:225 start_codon:yes stop_codon:yes gene_type:complete
MTDRLTKKDINQYLQEKGLKMMNENEFLRGIGKKEGVASAIGKGAKKRRRVKPGEEKKQGFSMGGMADYIKELL